MPVFQATTDTWVLQGTIGAGFKPGKQLANRHTEPWVHHVRIQVNQRLEHKPTPVHHRVRHDQRAMINHAVPVQQDIQVQCPRPPLGSTRRRGSPGAVFNGLKSVQQTARLQHRLEPSHRVEILPLRLGPHGVCFIDRAEFELPTLTDRTQRPFGKPNMRPAVTQIAPNTHKDVYHAMISNMQIPTPNATAARHRPVGVQSSKSMIRAKIGHDRPELATLTLVQT